MNTVIFDMDGVITDSEPINLSIIQGIYDEIGAQVPEDVHLSSLGVNSIEWWTFIINEYNVKGQDPEDLYHRERERILAYMTDPETDKGFFSGLTEVLEELKNKGFKLGLASASAYPIIKSILELGGLTDYFDVIVSATDPAVKLGKPEPDIFLYTADLLGARPEECLVIEDSERGLKAGKAAHMKTAAFLSAPKPICTDDADFIFADYSDFFDAVKF